MFFDAFKHFRQFVYDKNLPFAERFVQKFRVVVYLVRADVKYDGLGRKLKIFYKFFLILEHTGKTDAEIMNIIGNIEGKNCIIIDDMIDTAGTICNAANAIKNLGAKAVFAGATHAVLSGPAIERIKDSAIEEMVLLNTVPLPEEKKLDKMTFLSVAPLFAEAMTRVFTNGSISVLFD